jgi:hypothetical protein
VYGRGWSTDFYGDETSVFVGDVPCELDWYNSNDNRLVCTTRPHPTVNTTLLNSAQSVSPDARPADPAAVTVSVVINGQIVTCTWCRFSYRENSGAMILKITPNVAPPGALLSIDAYFATGNFDLTQLIIGDNICSTRDLETNAVYGVSSPYGGRFTFTCKLLTQNSGKLVHPIFKTPFGGNGPTNVLGPDYGDAPNVFLDENEELMTVVVHPGESRCFRFGSLLNSSFEVLKPASLQSGSLVFSFMPC